MNVIDVSYSPISEFDESITTGEGDFRTVFGIDVLFWVSLHFLGVFDLFDFNFQNFNLFLDLHDSSLATQFSCGNGSGDYSIISVGDVIPTRTIVNISGWIVEFCTKTELDSEEFIIHFSDSKTADLDDARAVTNTSDIILSKSRESIPFKLPVGGVSGTI